MCFPSNSFFFVLVPRFDFGAGIETLTGGRLLVFDELRVVFRVVCFVAAFFFLVADFGLSPIALAFLVVLPFAFVRLGDLAPESDLRFFGICPPAIPLSPSWATTYETWSDVNTITPRQSRTRNLRCNCPRGKEFY
jgi:hypothetical protein